MGDRMQPVIDAGGLPAAPLVAQRAAAWRDRALWAETHGGGRLITDGGANAAALRRYQQRRGNTLLALDALTGAVAISQSFGGNFDNAMWVISRQVWRELVRYRERLVTENRVGDADHAASLGDADDLIVDIEGVYFDEDFEADARSNARVGRVRDLIGAAVDAHYYLTDIVDQCNAPAYEDFPVDNEIRDISRRVSEAQVVNASACNPAFDAMVAELGAYQAEPDGPPGVDDIGDILAITDSIQPLIGQPVGIECADGACINDIDALTNELLLMDLVDSFESAGTKGVWVRNWQSCMVQIIRFRIELSLLRVAFACGINDPRTLRARDRQAQGLALVADGQDAEALTFYRESRCLILQTYNECLVPVVSDPVNTPFYEYPQVCENLLGADEP